VEAATLFTEVVMKSKLASLDGDMPIFCSESLPHFDRAVIREPSAVVLARLARDPDRSFSSPPLEPMYLKEPHVTMPKGAGSGNTGFRSATGRTRSSKPVRPTGL
jgi:hypothetical protein